MKAIVSAAAAAIAAAGLAMTLNVGEAAAKVPAASLSHGKVTFVYVGFGRNDAEIKRASRYYPLKLRFMLKEDAKDTPVSDVKVRIKDAHDKMVLNVTSDGGVLLARLPAGIYRISAEREGRTESRTIRVNPRKNQHTTFEWNA